MQLRKFIEANPHLTAKEVAQIRGISATTVRRCKVKTKPVRGTANRFDGIIREMYGKATAQEIATEIGQSKVFVRNRISIMKLASPKEAVLWYEKPNDNYSLIFDVNQYDDWIL